MWYGVRGGPRPGVYASWEEAKKYSVGHSGALAKKFESRHEAEAFAGVAPGAHSPKRSASRGPAESSESAPTAGAAACRAPAFNSDGRTYLEVPFAEKDQAKRQGAKWDPFCKKWYAPSPAALTQLSQWQGPAREPTSSQRPPQVEGKPCAQLDRKPLVGQSLVATPLRQQQQLSIYTDGACKGNANVATTRCPAGWGFVALECRRDEAIQGTVVAERFGPVVVDGLSDLFLGAEVSSNNTGELSAICEALLWLRDEEPSQRPAVIFYDSKYAAKVTSGEYKAQKNLQLVATAQSLFREVKASRTVKLTHVKGHSGQIWNDAADGLANRGAAGERCYAGRWSLPGVPGSTPVPAAGAKAPVEALEPPAKRPRTQ